MERLLRDGFLPSSRTLFSRAGQISTAPMPNFSIIGETSRASSSQYQGRATQQWLLGLIKIASTTPIPYGQEPQERMMMEAERWRSSKRCEHSSHRRISLRATLKILLSFIGMQLRKLDYWAASTFSRHTRRPAEMSKRCYNKIWLDSLSLRLKRGGGHNLDSCWISVSHIHSQGAWSNANGVSDEKELMEYMKIIIEEVRGLSYVPLKSH